MPVINAFFDSSGKRRAAQYIRMSTEHQKYSLQNQMDALAAYAACRGIEIVQTYADAAKSGLHLEGRPELARLLQDAQTGVAGFDLILVYDVSRWGRFQDVDESAHYEFLCKAAGVSVRYCAEPFEEDGFATSLLKLLKRAMAAEYIRELSAKTFAGQCNLVRQGFHAAGAAPYGLRRLLLDENGKPKGQLARGQHKNIKTERVILTLGPLQEVETVRRIFRLYATERRTEDTIAAVLNAEGIPVEPSGVWTRARVHKILVNENYIGTLVFNRRTQKFQGKSRPNPPETWVRCAEAFESIIDAEGFRAAQQRMAERTRDRTDDELLASLSKLHRKAGRLTKEQLSRSRDVPDPTTYRRRFGSLRKAYALIGHPPPDNYGALRQDGGLRSASNFFHHDVLAVLEASGATVAPQALQHPLYRINDRFTLRLAVAAATRARNGSLRWRILVRTPYAYDLTLAARMDGSNSAVMGYYFLPNLGAARVKISLGDYRSSRFSRFRTPSLRPLRRLCELKGLGGKFPQGVEELAAFLAGGAAIPA